MIKMTRLCQKGAAVISLLSVSLTERGGEFGSDVWPGKKEEVGGRVVKIWVCLSLLYSDLIGNKVYFAPDHNQWVIPPCPYTDP